MARLTSKNFVAAVEAEFRHFFSQFLHNESIGGIILLICTVISLLCANIPQLGALHEIWGKSAGISVGNFSLSMSIGHWINDGLMAIFFFVVGLEIKREMLVGELSSFKHASLPIFAAIGGMIVPALLYTLFNADGDFSHGWGIPMATDIAFAIGVLSLLGKRVPLGLKVFLTALAIVDDLGAIVVLAVFYPSHALHFDMLLYALAVVLILYFFNRNKVNNMLFYIIPGIALWFLILKSGIHATIAGVILAMTIPSRTVINEVKFMVRVRYLLEKFKNASNSEVEVLANPRQQHIIHRIDKHVQEINPLLHKFETMLHPWVTFVIMPIFALANSGGYLLRTVAGKTDRYIPLQPYRREDWSGETAVRDKVEAGVCIGHNSRHRLYNVYIYRFIGIQRYAPCQCRKGRYFGNIVHGSCIWFGSHVADMQKD